MPTVDVIIDELKIVDCADDDEDMRIQLRAEVLQNGEWRPVYDRVIEEDGEQTTYVEEEGKIGNSSRCTFFAGDSIESVPSVDEIRIDVNLLTNDGDGFDWGGSHFHLRPGRNRFVELKDVSSNPGTQGEYQLTYTVNVRPEGESRIERPYYPDGTLLRGGGDQIYLIAAGQRRRVPQDATEVGAGIAFPRLSERDLAAIPAGPALEVALEEYREQDEVISDMPRRYMSTNATLSQEAGRLDAWTRTWTRQPWFGFTGGVVVLFGDTNGEFIGNTDLHQFGVDGFRIPFKRWNREDWWSEAVAPDLAARTTRLEIVHVHAPRDRLFAFLEDLRTALGIVAEIAARLRQIYGGEESAVATPRSAVAPSESSAPSPTERGTFSEMLAHLRTVEKKVDELRSERRRPRAKATAK
jgi:hypothetical protein